MRVLLRSEAGLTLIELLVVLVILGLFSTFVFQAMTPKIDKAKVQTARTQMEILALALENYRLDVGNYPDSLEELVQSSAERWNGPYLQPNRVPMDPWQNDYVYEVAGEGDSFTISSTGGGRKEIRYGELE